MVMAIAPMHGGGEQKRKGIITKEFFVGLLAIVLGGYNLYYLYTGKTFLGIAIPDIITQSVANIILVVAGLILWLTAYKLWRFRWHSRGLF
jgi:hypothetical protein